MGSAFGISTASNQNYTTINDAITQQYAGSCDFSCDNSIKNTNIDIINSTVDGGITLQNACSIDGVCTISSNLDCVSDVVYKANQSSNASAPGVFSVEISDNTSYTTVNQAVSQSVSEKCKVQSSNEIVNTQVFAANSKINGGINIKNDANVTGNCVLSNIMQAMENASLTVDQTSAAGKKAGKCGSCSGAGAIAAYIGVGLLIIVCLVGVAYGIKKYKDSKS